MSDTAPTAPASGTSHTTSSATPSGAAAQSRSVLLVDDSKFARLLVRAFITAGFDGWQIDEAENADQALERVAQREYDYFLVDFNMPGMNGLELGKILRGRFPDATVALLTANIQQEIRNQTEKLGMDFLAKPPTEEKIVAFLKAQEAAK